MDKPILESSKESLTRKNELIKYKQKGILQKDKQTKTRKMAERTGLEPATTGVTGRYSNQLNYHSINLIVVGAEGIEPPTLAL